MLIRRTVFGRYMLYLSSRRVSRPAYPSLPQSPAGHLLFGMGLQLGSRWLSIRLARVASQTPTDKIRGLSSLTKNKQSSAICDESPTQMSGTTNSSKHLLQPSGRDWQ